MTVSVAAEEHSTELDFKGKPIRAVAARSTLWFAASDLTAALGYSDYALDEAANSRLIPDYCRCRSSEIADPEIPGDPNPEVLLLSPIGVWLWTHETDPVRGQGLAAWTKRMANELVPQLKKDDPASFLVMPPTGCDMPYPYPTKYSGRKSEFCALKDALDDRLFASYRRA